MLVLTNIDLNNNELQNVRLQNLAAGPSSPLGGRVYFNTADKKFYGWNETGWVNLGASGGTTDYNDLTNKPIIPTKTSDITNDSSFVTSAITDALNTEIQNIKTVLDDDKDGNITDLLANLKAQWENADSSLQVLVTQKTSKFTQVIGDASATAFTITHNLNTLDVIASIRSNQAPYDVIITDITIVDANRITVTFAQAPSANQYKVIIIG